MKNYKRIRSLWTENAPHLWWGDPLDVRFFLCEELSRFKNKNVLDVACNAGIVSSLMTHCDVTGVDINKDAIDVARRINPSFKYFVADIFKLNNLFENESFDIIILSHVLPKDNFPSEKFPIELMDVIFPLLKKGGILFITTPNPARAFNGKNKFINDVYLTHLLNRYNLRYDLRYWCKWNIHLNHLFKFIPNIWNLLISMSFKKGRSVSFYVKAIKK
ncbi:class I SAM-dependent methyltransferase [Candidatus Woesearchaeota archaeon]|nr:class I SAM-dependent methyltransferase [Candidatus Woesearchaeota archaeon]